MNQGSDWQEPRLWSSHPDALLVVHDGIVVDANPATEMTFGRAQSWLIGKPLDLIVPRDALSRPERGPLFRAWRGDDQPFFASASAVPMPTDRELIVVRDVSQLVSWLTLSTGMDVDLDRLAELDARERAVDITRETVIQYIFGAGIALQQCLDNGTDVNREHLERAIEVLDQAMTDLVADQ